MISADLLSVLMRGIQARHLDWGAGAESLQPADAGFARFFQDGTIPLTSEAAASVAAVATAPEEEIAAAPGDPAALPVDAPAPEQAAPVPPLPFAAGAGPVEGCSGESAETEADAEMPPAVASQIAGLAKVDGMEAASQGGDPTAAVPLRSGVVSPPPGGAILGGSGGEPAEAAAEFAGATEAAEAVDPAGAPGPATVASSATDPLSAAVPSASVGETEVPEDGRVGGAMPEETFPADRPASAPPGSPAPQQPAGGPAPPNSAPVPLALAPGDAELGWRLSAEPASSPSGAVREAANATAGAPPGPASAVTGQVAMAIRASEGDRIEIRLDPPELGRVQIEMRVVEGALHAVVVAERAEVSDLLRRHAEMLQRELENAGYGEVSLDFAAGRQDGSDRRDDARGGGRPLDVVAAAPAAAPATRAGGDSRLDIRL